MIVVYSSGPQNNILIITALTLSPLTNPTALQKENNGKSLCGRLYSNVLLKVTLATLGCQVGDQDRHDSLPSV